MRSWSRWAMALSRPAAPTDCLPRSPACARPWGRDVDLMVDVHGPPWLTTRDAIALGQRLEEYDLLFYEDPVAPENIEGIRRVAESVNIPIGVGERHSYLWGVRQLLEEEIADVIQPDTGRAGGLLQLKKIAALAEAHYALIAPHDGSLGPVAEMGAAHVLATVPNFLLLEHLADDVPARYEVMQPQPRIVDGSIVLSDAPGLGVDIVEDAIRQVPIDRQRDRTGRGARPPLRGAAAADAPGFCSSAGTQT